MCRCCCCCDETSPCFHTTYTHTHSTGANQCYGRYHRVYPGVDDDDFLLDGGEDLSVPDAVQPLQVAAPPSGPPYVSWVPAGDVLREKSILEGRAVAPSSPLHIIANRTLVDSPRAVAVPDPTADAVFYTDIGARIIQLRPSDHTATVVVDFNLSDSEVISSLSAKPQPAGASGAPTLWFTLNSTVWEVVVGQQPVARYACPRACTDVAVDADGVAFSMSSATNSTLADVYVLKAQPGVSDGGSYVADVVAKGLRAGTQTLLPLALDSANKRVFAADFVYGLQLVPLQAGGAARLTVVEPEGYVLSMTLQGTTLHYLTFVGTLGSVDVSAPSVSRSRRLRETLGYTAPIPAFGIAWWHGDLVGSRGPTIVHGSVLANLTVLYGQYYRDFSGPHNRLQFIAEQCKVTSLQCVLRRRCRWS